MKGIFGLNEYNGGGSLIQTANSVFVLRYPSNTPSVLKSNYVAA